MPRLILQTALDTTTITTGEGADLDRASGANSAAERTGADSFERLVALHEPRVRRLAHRLLGWRGGPAGGDHADVDDVVQEVFLVLLKKLDTFRGDSSLATWLTTVTINKCRTHQRRRWLRLKWLDRYRPPRFSEEARAADHEPLRDDTNERVRAAVQQLSRADREVIVLFYLEELASADIAAVLCVSSNVVDVRLHRARKRLKEKLADLVNE